MVEALIVVACYAAFWSSLGSATAIVRPLIFVSLLVAACWAVASNRIRRIAPTPLEYLFYAIGLLSAGVSLVRSADYSITYTMYFLMILVFLSIVTRAVSLEKLLDLSAIVMLLCVITCLLVDGRSLVAALEVSIGPNGLERFSPLDNHPLLTGYMFGSGAFLLARRAILASRRAERYAMTAGAVLSGVFLLAASARSSIVALAVAAAFAVFVEFPVLGRLSAKRLTVIVAALIVSGAVCLGFASDYIVNILQIDSAYRGVGTGATGRTDLWMRGIESLLSDPYLLALGGGLRSSEYSVIGFLTENSYLTFLLDSGLFLGSTLILFLLYSPIQALRAARAGATGGKDTLILLPSFLLFPLVQCFYIRSYIGISNTASILVLLMLISLSMRAGFVASPQSAERKMALPAQFTPRTLRTKS